MTRLEAALVEVTSFLEDRRIPYMIIGGFANLFWGVERFTRDLDVTIEMPDQGLEELVQGLGERFDLSGPDAVDFARRNHLIQFQTRTEVPVDLIIAALPYETAAIRRALTAGVADREVRLCSPEDLIIHKLASERRQDAADVEGIILRQSKRIDRQYLGARVRELSAGLERPEIVDFYEELLRKADSLPAR